MGSLLEKMKADAQKAGTSRGKFFYVKDGTKKRIRFLQDMNDGFDIPFHDSYELNINVPCQEVFGRDCPYCDEEELRTRSLYAWSVWDYDASEVKIFMYAMNNCTPLASIAAMYETYGTLLDNDFVISRTGKQQNTQYTVIPMEKQKFRNSKAKPYSKSAFLKILDEAYPDEHSGSNGGTKSKKSKKNDYEELNYQDMSPKELYNLCEEREIEAEPKMKAKYYIDLLEEYDEDNFSENMNEPEDTDDDGWEENEPEENDYSSMSAKELYNLCKERNIESSPKKPEKYYINLLKEDDKAHDEWEDEDSDEEEDW